MPSARIRSVRPSSMRTSIVTGSATASTVAGVPAASGATTSPSAPPAGGAVMAAGGGGGGGGGGGRRAGAGPDVHRAGQYRDRGDQADQTRRTEEDSRRRSGGHARQ